MTEETKIYRQGGKRWELPEVLQFRDRWNPPVYNASGPIRNYFFYNVYYRKPKKGEWYLSGAIVEPYQALTDLDDDYLVAVPTDRAKQIQTWVVDHS
jgi:hypothetical protein